MLEHRFFNKLLTIRRELSSFNKWLNQLSCICLVGITLPTW
jgi:hypothetical protein